MEFPITRARLQNIGEEYIRITNEKTVIEIVEALSNQIIQKACDPNYKNLQISVGNLGSISTNVRVRVRSRSSIDDYIPKVMTKLQERFPDITIRLDSDSPLDLDTGKAYDPMKSYIYIDWS
jgi:hypothetical protein